MKETCKNASRYKGKTKPKCCGGKGCKACWNTYEDAQVMELYEALHTEVSIECDICGAMETESGSDDLYSAEGFYRSGWHHKNGKVRCPDHA